MYDVYDSLCSYCLQVISTGSKYLEYISRDRVKYNSQTINSEYNYMYSEMHNK
jgi:hypothetical protein